MKVECPVQLPGGLAMCSHGHSFCTVCRVMYLHHWLNSPYSFHSFLSSRLLLVLERPRYLEHPFRGMLSWKNDWCSRAISLRFVSISVDSYVIAPHPGGGIASGTPPTAPRLPIQPAHALTWTSWLPVSQTQSVLRDSPLLQTVKCPEITQERIVTVTFPNVTASLKVYPTLQYLPPNLPCDQ